MLWISCHQNVIASNFVSSKCHWLFHQNNILWISFHQNFVNVSIQLLEKHTNVTIFLLKKTYKISTWKLTKNIQNLWKHVPTFNRNYGITYNLQLELNIIHIQCSNFVTINMKNIIIQIKYYENINLTKQYRKSYLYHAKSQTESYKYTYEKHEHFQKFLRTCK